MNNGEKMLYQERAEYRQKNRDCSFPFFFLCQYGIVPNKGFGCFKINAAAWNLSSFKIYIIESWRKKLLCYFLCNAFEHFLIPWNVFLIIFKIFLGYPYNELNYFTFSEAYVFECETAIQPRPRWRNDRQLAPIGSFRDYFEEMGGSFFYSVASKVRTIWSFILIAPWGSHA